VEDGIGIGVGVNAGGWRNIFVTGVRTEICTGAGVCASWGVCVGGVFVLGCSYWVFKFVRSSWDVQVGCVL
jgi:hypothetical protein